MTLSRQKQTEKGVSVIKIRLLSRIFTFVKRAAASSNATAPSEYFYAMCTAYFTLCTAGLLIFDRIAQRFRHIGSHP